MWKNALSVPFLAAASWLIREDPEESPRHYVGFAIAALLAVAYLAEEVFWIARNQGRPCVACGHKIRLKPFRLSVHCPNCGRCE